MSNPFEETKEIKSKIESVLDEVHAERWRQLAKWGQQNHPLPCWMCIIGEESGEVDEAILENDIEGAREELVQVAACAVATIEYIDRELID